MRNQLDETTRTWGMACHLCAIAGFIVPFGSILAPLVVWLAQKAKHPFIDEQGKESVNFQISMLIYSSLLTLVGFALYILGLFFSIYLNYFTIFLSLSLLFLPISIVALIVTLVAAIKAYNGQSYRYPFNLRFLKQCNGKYCVINKGMLLGKTVVSAATFSMCTVAAPIALGLTIGTGVFSTTMFALGKIEENKLSQFLADVIIASLPMVRVDGEFSEDEKLAIQQLLANPKIQQKDKDRVKAALNTYNSFDDIIAKNLLYEQKEEKVLIKRSLILSITWEIAKADGKVDDNEIALHNRMAKILQVSQKNVNEVRRLITPKLLLHPC